MASYEIRKPVTIHLPGDLADAIDTYLAQQQAPSSLTALVQAARQRYLAERSCLRMGRTLSITPAGKCSGFSDISQRHDLYLVAARK